MSGPCFDGQDIYSGNLIFDEVHDANYTILRDWALFAQSSIKWAFGEFGEKSMIWSILYYIYSVETPKTTHFAES